MRKALGLLCFSVALLLVLSSCSQEKLVHITWTDTGGAVIAQSSEADSYDPTQRPLPTDTEQWHYTGWKTAQNGDQIRCIAQRVPKNKVLWFDADGTLLQTSYLLAEDISADHLPLPEDSDQWDYTQWSRADTADCVIFTAKRVSKYHHLWKTSDGTVIKECYLTEETDPEEVELPQASEQWTYTEWSLEHVDDEYVYTAEKIPNSEYFLGNVFQIVVSDEGGEPLGTGSGFVINDSGWFITNYHVMDGAFSATAYFDIADTENGDRYTQLPILGCSYCDEKKDFFIGKLDGYAKIKDYYHDIPFTETYTAGEASYTLGYPNSSVKMEVNSGKILDEHSDITDKINGVFYVLADSYIAPGSSGGILINDSFEVIGITSVGFYSDSSKTDYQAGGSIPTIIFAPHLKDIDDSIIKSLPELLNKEIDKGET